MISYIYQKPFAVILQSNLFVCLLYYFLLLFCSKFVFSEYYGSMSSANESVDKETCSNPEDKRASHQKKSIKVKLIIIFFLSLSNDFLYTLLTFSDQVVRMFTGIQPQKTLFFKNGEFSLLIIDLALEFQGAPMDFVFCFGVLLINELLS